MAQIYYLTHPQVQIDPAVPVPQWGLSAVGRARVERLAASDFAKRLTRVISSKEVKAIETAKILADVNGLGVTAIEALHENDRSATGFLPPPEFEVVASQFFAEPEVSIRGWERALDAQARVAKHVLSEITECKQEDVILFAGHGAVGTLLLCHLNGWTISRAHDQTSGGNFITFEWPLTGPVAGWRPLEELV